MRLRDFMEHALDHAAYAASITVDQHHVKPSSIQVSNTTLVVPPLPGGPGQWDIALPFDAQAVLFNFRSAHLLLGTGVAGLTGVARRNSPYATDTVVASLGGDAPFAGYGSYNCIYAKAAGSLQLSHKIFSSAGQDITLTDAWIETTGPTARVLRTWWTNFGAGNRTLNVWGEVAVLG
jgi:hypothetical protein